MLEFVAASGACKNGHGDEKKRKGDEKEKRDASRASLRSARPNPGYSKRPLKRTEGHLAFLASVGSLETRPFEKNNEKEKGAPRSPRFARSARRPAIRKDNWTPERCALRTSFRSARSVPGYQNFSKPANMIPQDHLAFLTPCGKSGKYGNSLNENNIFQSFKLSRFQIFRVPTCRFADLQSSKVDNFKDSKINNACWKILIPYCQLCIISYFLEEIHPAFKIFKMF